MLFAVRGAKILLKRQKIKTTMFEKIMGSNAKLWHQISPAASSETSAAS